MIRDQAEWEMRENDKYFSHTRNNGDNYYDPDSWDIAPDTPQKLIDSFNATMEEAKIWKKWGFV